MKDTSAPSLFLIPEMFSRKFRSVSWINRPDVPDRFDNETRLDLFCQEIWDIKDNLLNATQAGEAAKPIPVCHITYGNGSEQDLYAHVVQKDDFAVFLEVSHSYIDQHFLSIQLWATDQKQAPTYPTDLLFRGDPIHEATRNKPAKIETFIRPVALTIHTWHFDASPYLPNESTLFQLKEAVATFPPYLSWEAFEQGEYGVAAANILPFLAGDDPTDTLTLFMKSYYATIKYLAGDYASAAEHFLSVGSGYSSNGLPRNADVRFCFAIEAGKRITDLNVSYRVLADVVAGLGFLGADYKGELVNILKNYYSEVYIGAAVLCRRVIELYLTELLTTKHGKTVKELTKAAKAAGQIPKDARPGLFTVLCTGESPRTDYGR